MAIPSDIPYSSHTMFHPKPAVSRVLIHERKLIVHATPLVNPAARFMTGAPASYSQQHGCKYGQGHPFATRDVKADLQCLHGTQRCSNGAASNKLLNMRMFSRGWRVRRLQCGGVAAFQYEGK